MEDRSSIEKNYINKIKEFKDITNYITIKINLLLLTVITMF